MPIPYIAYFYRMPGKRKKLAFYAALFILVISLIAVGVHQAFKSSTRSIYKNALLHAPFDVIIVPGIPYNSAQSNYMLKVRMHWAVTLYKRGITRNIIFSGAAVHTPYVESKAMQIIADTLGLPVEHLFCETRAEHSSQNLLYGWQLAHQLGFKKIALATDAFQSYFLGDFIVQRTPDVFQLPLAADSLDIYAKPLPAIDARQAEVNNFVPLEQRESRWERFKHSYMF